MAPKKSDRKKLTAEEFAPFQDQFWAVCAPLMERDRTEEGTMMGTPCLRVGKEFLGMVTPSFSGRLIVKLPAERVQELIADGTGDEFSPAGKVFKEWLFVKGDDVDVWEKLVAESWDFVSAL